MAMVLTQEGATAFWQQILGIGSGIGIPYVRLLGASYNPTHTSTLANFAANELSVGGYAPVPLANPSVDWTITAITAGAQATYVLITFTFTGACNVYGYFLSDASNTVSLLGEGFPTPFNYGSLGGSFGLQLPITLTSPP